MRKLLRSLAIALPLAACSGAQIGPPGLPGISEVNALTAQTAGIADISSFYTNGLTLVQMRCRGYFDEATLAALQRGQQVGQVNAASALLSGVGALGGLGPGALGGAGLGASTLAGLIAGSNPYSLAGARPATTGTLVVAGQQALVAAMPQPRTGAEAYARLFDAYAPCSPMGIEALQEQAVAAAVNHLSVVGSGPGPMGRPGLVAPAYRTYSIRVN